MFVWLVGSFASVGGPIPVGAGTMVHFGSPLFSITSTLGHIAVQFFRRYFSL